jgi:hypothetical protein
MTQVYRVFPLWLDRTTPARRLKHPGRGFSDKRKGHGGRIKLSDDDVRAIRLAGDWKWPPALVAKLFNISLEYAQMMMRGESHAHVR